MSYITGVIIGLTGLLAVLMRNWRIEKLLGRDIPAQVSDTLTADRDATARAAAHTAAITIAATATAAEWAAAGEQRTMQDVARVMAAALATFFENAPPLAEHHEELVEQLIDVLQRQSAWPLPPLLPMPVAPWHRAHRTPTSFALAVPSPESRSFAEEN